MALSEIKEIWRGRDGEESLDARTYTRVFRAITTSRFDAAEVVLSSPLIPPIGAGYPTDPLAFCQKRKATNEGFSAQVWLATVNYSTEREHTENPLQEPAEIEWDSEQFQRPFFEDNNNQAILNSAGDPFEDPVEGDDSRRSVSIKRNFSAVPSWILDYQDAVNNASVPIDGIIVPPGAAKVQRVSVSKWQERNGIAFRTVTLIIHLARDGWAKRILDAGLRQIDPQDPTKRIACVDADGNEVTEPVPLDGEGAQLENPSPSNAVFRTFDIYQMKNFFFLPLS